MHKLLGLMGARLKKVDGSYYGEADAEDATARHVGTTLCYPAAARAFLGLLAAAGLERASSATAVAPWHGESRGTRAGSSLGDSVGAVAAGFFGGELILRGELRLSVMMLTAIIATIILFIGVGLGRCSRGISGGARPPVAEVDTVEAATRGPCATSA